jgi:hypothetical protein
MHPTFDTVFSVLLPVYLQAANGDLDVAHAALTDLIDSHDAVNAAEVELVSRIHTLSYLARDSMTRSLNPDLADNLVLRYRSSATTMLRTAQQCRKALDAMQTLRRQVEAEQAVQRHNDQIDAFTEQAANRIAERQAERAWHNPPHRHAYPDPDISVEQLQARVTETQQIIRHGKAGYADAAGHQRVFADPDCVI